MLAYIIPAALFLAVLVLYSAAAEAVRLAARKSDSPLVRLAELIRSYVADQEPSYEGNLREGGSGDAAAAGMFTKERGVAMEEKQVVLDLPVQDSLAASKKTLLDQGRR